MKVTKFFNPGPYGVFEDDMVIYTGDKRILVHECGVRVAPADYTFKNQEEMVKLLSNSICANEDLQTKLLHIFNPDAIARFVENHSYGATEASDNVQGFMEKSRLGIGVSNIGTMDPLDGMSEIRKKFLTPFACRIEVEGLEEFITVPEKK